MRGTDQYAHAYAICELAVQVQCRALNPPGPRSRRCGAAPQRIDRRHRHYIDAQEFDMAQRSMTPRGSRLEPALEDPVMQFNGIAKVVVDLHSSA